VPTQKEDIGEFWPILNKGLGNKEFFEERGLLKSFGPKGTPGFWSKLPLRKAKMGAPKKLAKKKPFGINLFVCS